MVGDDLAAERLVRQTIGDPAVTAQAMTMSAVYPAAAPPGPAGRWLIDRLRRGAPAVAL